MVSKSGRLGKRPRTISGNYHGGRCTGGSNANSARSCCRSGSDSNTGDENGYSDYSDNTHRHRRLDQDRHFGAGRNSSFSAGNGSGDSTVHHANFGPYGTDQDQKVSPEGHNPSRLAASEEKQP